MYLAAIAARRPAEVAEVILEVPDTDNLAVHVDFVRAALAMSPNEAERVMQREVEWVEARAERTYLAPDLGAEIAAKLAHAGKLDAATDVLKSLLGFRAQTSASRDRNPRVQDWQYEPAIATGVRALEEADPRPAMTP